MRALERFEELVGCTVAGVEGLERGSDEVTLRLVDGRAATLFHERDCCESVRLVDVCGDPEDLVGSPVVLAEEVSNAEDPEDHPAGSYGDDSHTWTFYRLGTARGTVVLRWLGESNGYYSERVAFGCTETDAPPAPPPVAPLASRRRAFNLEDPDGT